MKQSTAVSGLDNEQIAAILTEVAELLEAQGANPFRVRAYRRGAESVKALDVPVRQLIEKPGRAALRELPGIGESLAHSIEQLARSGRFPLWERLRGDDAAERLFATIPDIGRGLAHRIHEELGIETLAELQAAAQDGRLAKLSGMGPKRLQAVRESLTARFRRQQPTGMRQTAETTNVAVDVGELLDVDQEYRRLARRNKLPRVAPRKFNPTAQAWLPILHTRRGDHQYTALFSNTARAHEMGTIHDWVVIYRDDARGNGRWTVITSHFGPLQGRRIIRGLEDECLKFYQKG